MILTYKLIEANDPCTISIWEKDTNTNKERCIYDEDYKDSYKQSYKDWEDKPQDDWSLPELVGKGLASRISRTDAILEMI